MFGKAREEALHARMDALERQLNGLEGVTEGIQSVIRTIETRDIPDSDVQGLRQEFADEAHALRSRLDDHETALLELDQYKRDITLAVDEGIRHVERAERRVRQTIRRTQQKLEDVGLSDPALDAEAQEYFDADESGGGEEEVQPVQADVGPDLDGPSSVPGVTLRQLAQARGL